MNRKREPTEPMSADATTSASAEPSIVLIPDLRAIDALRVIHWSLVETVLANEPGVREGRDPEFLHKLRVAVRRARSALAQLRGVFDADAVAHLKTELKWLQTVTGPVRDLDVYLLKMDEYREDLPEAIREHLDPLATYLHNHHAMEQQRLLTALDSPRYRALVDDWQALVAPERAIGAECPNAVRPITELAAERTWRAYRRVRREGDAITEHSPAHALHALRIECKKLRYLLEFFTSLFDARKVAALVTALKELQDNLGDFNDLCVQQEKLTHFAHDMVREQHVGADSLLAMGRLVEHLAARQAGERVRFERSYAHFARRGVRKRFRRLFKRDRRRK